MCWKREIKNQLGGLGYETKYLFKQVIVLKAGFLILSGGDLKKESFVEKGINTYKVYEQGVVLNVRKILAAIIFLRKMI